MLLLLNIAVSIYGIIVAASNLKNGVGSYSLDIACISILGLFGLASFGFGIFVVMLCITHWLFVAKNQTTAEFLKDMDDNKLVNPFRKWGNKFDGEECEEVLYIKVKKE